MLAKTAADDVVVVFVGFRFIYNGIILSIIYYLLFMVITTWRQLQSLAGMALFVFVPWLLCNNPTRVSTTSSIEVSD